MGELTLTAQELLFAGAQLGAKTFFGLPDPFYGMTLEEIRQEIGQMQVSLEKKGYAEMGFDDAFTLKPEVSAMVEACAKCLCYLLVRLTPPGKKAWQLLIYAGEAGLVEVDAKGEELKLNWIDQKTVSNKILAEIRPVADNGSEVSTVVVKQAELAQAQSLAIDEPGKALELLESQGCPSETATLLVQGFRHEAGRYVFCKSDFQTRTLDEMILLQSEGGAVCLTLENVDEDLWKAEFLPCGANEETLRGMCALKGATDEML